MKKKLRKMGDITLDMEKLLQEMTHGHELQHGEILAIVNSWLLIHAPLARETYSSDSTHPEFYYGYPRDKK